MRLAGMPMIATNQGLRLLLGVLGASWLAAGLFLGYTCCWIGAG
jgi:hypothetical protein